ncbi:MAG: hypothetical protein K2G96_02415, partial [Clostridia bacterium]|nr:hypothetical protein [Clostridia bacterium]
VRGGNAYMYNCLVDNSQYYEYRTTLRSKNAASLVKSVNSGWKCALVSQGIVCGNGGSVKSENCIYRGIETLLKNNDSNSADLVKGGYELVNCSYRIGKTDTEYVGSSVDTNNKFTNSSTGILKPDYFHWNTEEWQQPFVPSVTALNELEVYLTESVNGCGARSDFEISLLKSSY